LSCPLGHVGWERIPLQESLPIQVQSIYLAVNSVKILGPFRWHKKDRAVMTNVVAKICTIIQFRWHAEVDQSCQLIVVSAEDGRP
jgi:hypothetical protein